MLGIDTLVLVPLTMNGAKTVGRLPHDLIKLVR
jgi:hypothetical protein